MKRALVILRRDLRIEDNTALLQASKDHEVLVCFIVDPVQVTAENKFLSHNALQFMIESLQELQQAFEKQGGRLYIFYGHTSIIVKKILHLIPLSALYVNKDYTPFSIQRDHELEQLCAAHAIPFISCPDILLQEPQAMLKHDGTPYTVFTPFFNAAHTRSIERPHKRAMDFYTKAIDLPQVQLEHEFTAHARMLSEYNPATLTGGRKQAQKILKSISDFKNYAHIRDYPAYNTSHLSAHLKFGTVSIREVYHAIQEQLGKDHPMIRSLYWRDFYTHIAYNFPHVFGAAFKEKFNNISWSYNQDHFQRWCLGQTGFPIVDAGMRELNATGFMHNRVRMITASFLIKDLHIDWQLGERYFARMLVDYDPCVNNGNWQWVASTGCDAQPYFRIFNPWLQQKKFDPECLYIKQWVPELRASDAQIIHALYDKKIVVNNYCRPIVDHKEQAKKALLNYKKIIYK